ncbi:YceI family protein [Aquimarina rhabdastrellae]
MKFKIFGTLAITALLFATSCKEEKKNEVTTTESKEVKEAPVTAVNFNVDAANSTLAWVGSKPTGKHEGTIKLKSGVLNVKEGTLEGGSFVVDMNSIVVTDIEGEDKEHLEAHLKGLEKDGEDHFFNVTKFPTAAFEITGVTTANGVSTVQGNLTIKGISKNISFPATFATTAEGASLTSEVFTINRTEWNVNYASKSVFEDLGDRFINDDIEIKIDLKATK